LTRIYLVRHGQTVWNRELIFRGQADVPLNDTGRKQAELAGEALKDVNLAAIYASPLSRAAETAEAIARRQNVSVGADPAFNDFDCGRFQGLTLEAAKGAFPDIYETWEKTPHLVRFPEGGSLHDVTNRAMPRLKELSEQHRGRNIAVVTHRVVLKVILCQVLWGDNSHFWEVNLDTGSISRIESEGDTFAVRRQNDTRHLRSMNADGAKTDF